VDNLQRVPDINSKFIRFSEENLSKKSDICFVTANYLADYTKNLGFKNVFYEPNVSDYEHFSQARSIDEQPEDLKGIPHPRLIFIGMVGRHKIDVGLLNQLSKEVAQSQLILIGDIHDDESSLPKGPNIHYLGPKHYHVLPKYLGHADIALIPAPINGYTLGMFPMKFFEYLAAGLPVVSTNLPTLEEFKHVAFVSADNDEFIKNVKDVLSGARKDQALIDSICRYHSWENRFLRMEEKIKDILSAQFFK
jgi:glycosyltransferase involved in cell wall biosynthesis